MATSPMMPGAEPPMQPEMEGEGGAEICIKVAADGSLSVYMEGGEGESQPQPVADIGQALKAALELYRSMPQPGGGEQEQFAAGFGSETRTAQPRGMY